MRVSISAVDRPTHLGSIAAELVAKALEAGSARVAGGAVVLAAGGTLMDGVEAALKTLRTALSNVTAVSISAGESPCHRGSPLPAATADDDDDDDVEEEESAMDVVGADDGTARESCCCCCCCSGGGGGACACRLVAMCWRRRFAAAACLPGRLAEDSHM